MKRLQRRGFSLVELLVVIGIIALLIAFLMPAIAKAQRQSKKVACQSNLHQVGVALLIYSNQSRGWLFPPRLYPVLPPPGDERWRDPDFEPGIWEPLMIICPSDINPLGEFSYILNFHLFTRGIKAGSSGLGGLTPSDVIVMGEKRTDSKHYFMEAGYFNDSVELYRHGISVGSNYLFFDWHVGSQMPTEGNGGIDPWDVRPAPPVTIQQ